MAQHKARHESEHSNDLRDEVKGNHSEREQDAPLSREVQMQGRIDKQYSERPRADPLRHVDLDSHEDPGRGTNQDRGESERNAQRVDEMTSGMRS
jgi:hypothetical protein